ncbi:MAG: 3-hydroxyacyl-CoA dehydrogenase [Chloroflexi bacterium]|nr:3-hydroxyacyl-CoA dehydrogenase [Chloroflexota bacterium]|tara:strand:- start:3749 stop:4501 length:753 start_codon:yes stop_codon:yes gene_type:complete
MEFENVKKIGIVGGGVMGGGIAQVMAIGGYEVIVRDLTENIIQETKDSMFESKWGMKRSVEVGKLSFDNCVEAMERVSFTTDLNDLADVDMIIEAVPENLELKQQVFQELDEIIKPEAIFTSNTSGFVIEEIAENVLESRKQLFAGMHFFNPVPIMKAVEIISTSQTSDITTDTVTKVGEKAGKVTGQVADASETYGFIVNRIFAVARAEAQLLVDAGIASEEDIDRMMVGGRNWPVGFFGERGGIGQQW